MNVRYYAASSLDGYIATEDHGLDWLLQFGDVEETSYPDFIRDVGAIAMGSATYEWILRHQVHADTEESQSWPYQQPVWVFTSRSLPAVDGADIHFVSGDITPVYRQMVRMAGDSNIWIAGGGELAGQFFDQQLLDELIIQVTSVTLGGGIPLLPRTITAPSLKLISATTFGQNFVELHYEVQYPDNVA
ncbi:dihydrofolate reductase family protein [Fodinibius sediminis]|uniref:Dihydrofolate reductase n=1 Tax=Fodinibius sediminis TaxID=1214077 RepID=A0A521EM03_9BACT|nr:dihydrofolate reductase family protein [Fodinibius sediminis]SMO84955.1 Dihydrofolate reductase [Fodinibius sediminis]